MTRKVLTTVHIFLRLPKLFFFFLFLFSSLSLSRSSSSSDGDLRARRQPPRSISGHSDHQQPNRHHSERKSLAQVLKAIADFPRRVALVVGEWVWGEVTTWGKKKSLGSVRGHRRLPSIKKRSEGEGSHSALQVDGKGNSFPTVTEK